MNHTNMQKMYNSQCGEWAEVDQGGAHGNQTKRKDCATFYETETRRSRSSNLPPRRTKPMRKRCVLYLSTMLT